MNNLYKAGIVGKLYRLWYELNKSNRIQVLAGPGSTDKAETGENVTQGSIGGGLASALNLAVDVDTFFEGSADEVCYGNVRLQPTMFQDDLGRCSTSVQAAQSGNDKMDIIMNMKQLNITVYVFFYYVVVVNVLLIIIMKRSDCTHCTCLINNLYFILIENCEQQIDPT